MPWDETQEPEKPEWEDGYISTIAISAFYCFVLTFFVAVLFAIPATIYSGNRNASISDMYSYGLKPAFILSFVVWVGNAVYVIGAVGARRNEAYAIYKKRLADHQDFLARKHANIERSNRETAERKAREEERERLAQQEWDKGAPERARLAEEKRREAEVQARERALRVEHAERVRAWEASLNWARFNFEKQYAWFSFKVATELGVTDPPDILKMFSKAYLHLNICTDRRMGCLRELADSDSRIGAIVHFLPPEDEQNTRPRQARLQGPTRAS